jgi:hypothetical protein
MMAFDYAGKIRALLAHADDERLSDEARASYRARAMEFMRKYQIAEEEAIAVDPTSAVPMSIVIDFELGDARYDLHGFYPLIIRRIAEHTGVRVHTARGANYTSYRFTLVGYEGDVRYTEFLWTSAFLMFTTKVDPVWDNDLPVESNIYRLRAAGFKRKEIADRAWGYGAGDEAKNRSKVQRIYVREAAKNGEDAVASGLDFNSANYRRAYAEAFINTLTSRLRQARDAADSVGGVLDLHGRMDRVDDAFYDLFPNLRPSTTVSIYVDPRADCDRCKRAKSGYCQVHAYLRPRTWTQADEARWQRQQFGSAAQAGRASGRSAAAGVVIARGTDRQGNRVEGSGRAIEG